MYLAEYLGGRLFLSAAQGLPLPAAVKFGEWCGRQMIPWSRRSFRTAVDNLLQAFPDMTQPEAEALATRVYEHFGRAAVEVAFSDRLIRRSTFSDHLVVRNEHYLREVLAAGKGAIIVSAHLGPWEMFGVLAHHWGIPLTSVYRPPKNPYLDRFLRRYRAEHGQAYISKYGVARELCACSGVADTLLFWWISTLRMRASGCRFSGGRPRRRRRRRTWRSRPACRS